MKNGYEFIGWNTKKDGTGKTSFDMFTAGQEDVTLYAQWKTVAPAVKAVNDKLQTLLGKIQLY